MITKHSSCKGVKALGIPATLKCALGADATTTEDRRRWAAEFIRNVIAPHAGKGVGDGQSQWQHLSSAEVTYCEVTVNC